MTLAGERSFHTARISRVDGGHGSLQAAYAAIGKPQYPTREQIEELKRRAALPAPESVKIRGGEIPLSIPPNGIALLELS